MLDLVTQRSGDFPAGLTLGPATRVQRFIGRLMALGQRLIGKHRYDDFRLERVRGKLFVVTPTVFNPKIPRSGDFLASVIDTSLVGPQAEVLDMGTGSGVCAIFAAPHARRTVAVDINEAAIRCARINALLNQVEGRIDFRHGDLFGPVAGERFDLILFNPPFIRDAPRDDRDRAWRSTDVGERFAANLTKHMKPGGCACVVLSSFGDACYFMEEFRKQHLQISLFAERRFVNERLAIFRLTAGYRCQDSPTDA